MNDINKEGNGLNASAPEKVTRLVFIHHSCGGNWLADNHGRLGLVLAENNYYASDTYYGWGPGKIGDKTDIGYWWKWFRGPDSEKYMDNIYNEGGAYSECGTYTRLTTAPVGENEIIMFKSCFPNSEIKGSIDEIVPHISKNQLRGENCASEHMTVANCKGIYTDLLEYFKTRTDKLFIAITAPPLMENEYAANTGYFNNWLLYEWLKDYPYSNVRVFDYFNILTSNAGSTSISDVNCDTGNHHRYWKGEIQHVVDGKNDMLKYCSSGCDDHPNPVGNLKATAEFIKLLNIFYNEWNEFAYSSSIK